MSTLNTIQEEIYKAIKQMGEKTSFTEFHIAKKIRENAKLDGKKKAGIALADLMLVIECLGNEQNYYSIHINSVNECLIKKEDKVVELPLEAKQRRQKSEKSMLIITNGDISNANKYAEKAPKSGKKQQKRNERKKMSIYEDYND
ncbi:MAG: hypothetical protein MJ188_07610 [Treponema sp.]|nr:hypothetical protein [Treponema sp.]